MKKGDIIHVKPWGLPKIRCHTQADPDVNPTTMNLEKYAIRYITPMAEILARRVSININNAQLDNLADKFREMFNRR